MDLQSAPSVIHHLVGVIVRKHIALVTRNNGASRNFHVVVVQLVHVARRVLPEAALVLVNAVQRDRLVHSVHVVLKELRALQVRRA